MATSTGQPNILSLIPNTSNNLGLFGPDPMPIDCPSCGNRVTTRINYRSTTRTHMIFLLLCLLGLWPCACCLYCTKCARDVFHYCPTCNTFLGIYHR